MVEACMRTGIGAARVAPGRNSDMAMLLQRREMHPYGSLAYWKVQRKIDDLIEEGKCNVIWHERYRLVCAAKASDHEEILKISECIQEHMKYKHRRRFERGWIKEG